MARRLTHSQTFRMGTVLKAALDRAAVAEDRPPAWIIRRALIAWLRQAGHLPSDDTMRNAIGKAVTSAEREDR